MWISCIPYHSICNVLFDLRVSKWVCDSCAYYLLVRIWKLAMCFSVKKYLCSLKLTQIASFISTHILLPFRSDSLFYLEKWKKVHIIESTTGDIVKYIVREIICICIDILNCKWHPKKRQKPKSHERNVHVSHSHSNSFLRTPPYAVSTCSKISCKNTTETNEGKNLKSSKFHAKYFSLSYWDLRFFALFFFFA